MSSQVRWDEWGRKYLIKGLIFRDGISGMDFDSQSIYLAAGTKSGCLIVLKFDQMYCFVYGPDSGLHDDSHHICSNVPSDVVRWYPTNENEGWRALSEIMDIRLNCHEWKRNKIELDGKISYKNRQDYAHLLCDSYSEDSRSAGGLPNDIRCGILGMDFDSWGIHLAVGTKSGCLTVLKFDQMYCSVYGPDSGLHDDSHHICSNMPLDVVRWYPTNENEVCCGNYTDDKI